MPLVMLNAMVFLGSVADLTKEYDCAEFFSGVGNVGGSFVERGYMAALYDIERSRDFEDLTKPEGFLTAMATTIKCKPGALAHWATVCSSWVWVCRATTKRSMLNPKGDTRHQFVTDGNVMVARMVLLVLVGLALEVQWILEQPSSSIMPWTHWMRLLRSIVGTI